MAVTIIEAVGVAARPSKTADVELEMAIAVHKAQVAGVTDPEELRALILAARDKANGKTS